MRTAVPDYTCTLTDEEILDKIDAGIMRMANKGYLYASFPESWFRPEIGKDLMDRGFVIDDETFVSTYQDIQKDYRRIGW